MIQTASLSETSFIASSAIALNVVPGFRMSVTIANDIREEEANI